MKKSLVSAILLLCVSYNFSQTYFELWERGENFYTIQNKFNETFKDVVSNKGVGYKQFKRWEYYAEPRVYPSGDISLMSNNWKNFQEFMDKNKTTGKFSSTSQINSTTWMPMGPFGPLTGLSNAGWPRHAGRVNFMTFHPSVANTFWVGAPAGGLWKTTNNGASWSTTTDNLSVIGCSDLAINPANPNIMYLATGDGYWNSSYCIGVLTSTNAGATWTTTGLTFPESSTVHMRRLVINPTNPQVLIAATSNGVYTSTNAAVTWSLVSGGGGAWDVKFNAANSNTVYATGQSFSVSVNGGLTFTQISSGIPTNGYRMQIAVTPANPNYVYALISTNANPSVLYGVYRSVNAGTSFSLMYNTTNLLSADCYTPTAATGQGAYDLTIAASPLNANEIVVGGITAWQSMTGGTTWTNIGCGYNYNNGNPPFLHADHHELEYTSAGVLYSANDGGIFQFNGTQWPDLSTPMNIAQIYKLGLSTLSPNHWISGHQDNGSNIYTNGIYKASLFADGTDCFIDRTNNMNMFAEQAQGLFFYSSDAGTSWNTCTVSAPGLGAFVSPWKQDPQNATTFYCGKAQIKKSNAFVPPIWNAAVGTMTGVSAAQYVTEFAIAPSNNQKIYAIHGTTGMFISNNAAASWSLGSTGIPVGSGALTFVTVHPTNSLVAWATMSGYSAPNKVFKTVDGGLNWTNITYNLPNLPANCSVFEMNSTIDRVYVGMDVGIYYIDNTNPTVWTLYNTGLPNTPISDMEISPASPTKIRAATYGRGVYQADVVPSALPPVSAFNFAGTTCSVTASFLFNDISTNAPSSWTWNVNPSAGVTINTTTSQNPTITISNFGTYTVSLVATNGFGPGSLFTQTLMLAPPVVNASTSASVICNGQTVTLSASGVNTYTWQPGNLTGAIVSVTPSATQIYTVTGTDLNGCDGINSVSVTVTPCSGIISYLTNAFKYSIYPNPSYDKLNVMIGVDRDTDFELEILDSKGKQVLKQPVQYTQNKTTHQLNVSSLAGGVYFLKIATSEGSSQTIKLIKQ